MKASFGRFLISNILFNLFLLPIDIPLLHQIFAFIKLNRVHGINISLNHKCSTISIVCAHLTAHIAFHKVFPWQLFFFFFSSLLFVAWKLVSGFYVWRKWRFVRAKNCINCKQSNKRKCIDGKLCDIFEYCLIRCNALFSLNKRYD